MFVVSNNDLTFSQPYTNNVHNNTVIIILCCWHFMIITFDLIHFLYCDHFLCTTNNHPCSRNYCHPTFNTLSFSSGQILLPPLLHHTLHPSIHCVYFMTCTSQPQHHHITSPQPQILTQEDWNVVLFNGMEKTSHWASLYFVALMTFGNYVLFNLLVAILVEGFSAEVSWDPYIFHWHKYFREYVILTWYMYFTCMLLCWCIIIQYSVLQVVNLIFHNTVLVLHSAVSTGTLFYQLIMLCCND